MDRYEVDLMLMGGRKDFSGYDFSGGDLLWLDWSGVNLSGCNFEGAHLWECDFTGCVLDKAVLRGADLRGCVLRDASLVYADLTGASLREADLRGATLRGSNIRGVDFREARLEGVCWLATDFINMDRRIWTLFAGPRHWGYACNGLVKIGCLTHPVDVWLQFGVEIGIGQGYSGAEIEAYMDWIRQVKEAGI